MVTKRLTKPHVTQSVPMYQRGVSVDLAPPTQPDPLSYERSRVVVFLEGRGIPGQPVTAEMQQVHRGFSPDLLVVPVGSTVSFPNGDPVFHNVFSLSGVREFDLGNYPKGATRKVTFTKAGLVYVNCHLHSNMGAAIMVTPNRWYTRADNDGGFSLPEVPPGRYTIVAWHKTAGYFRREIEVVAGRTTTADFLLPLAGEK